MSERDVKAAQEILRVLHESVDPMGGWEIHKQAGVRIGRMYPVLATLEADGLIVGTWQDDAPSGKSRRRLYALAEEAQR